MQFRRKPRRIFTDGLLMPFNRMLKIFPFIVCHTQQINANILCTSRPFGEVRDERPESIRHAINDPCALYSARRSVIESLAR
jgi:hypothetical protein